MLIAEQGGTRKIATYSHKGEPYFCPECKEEVVLRKGKILTHHFAHKSTSNCSRSKGESKEHLRAKILIYEWALAKKMNCELEMPLETPLGKRYPGVHPKNICNRGSRGEGLQIELSSELRKQLLSNPDFLESFSQNIADTLKNLD